MLQPKLCAPTPFRTKKPGLSMEDRKLVAPRVNCPIKIGNARAQASILIRPPAVPSKPYESCCLQRLPAGHWPRGPPCASSSLTVSAAHCRAGFSAEERVRLRPAANVGVAGALEGGPRPRVRADGDPLAQTLPTSPPRGVQEGGAYIADFAAACPTVRDALEARLGNALRA